MREWLAGLVGENLAPIVSVVVSAAIVVLLALVIIGLAKRVFAGSGGIGGRSRAPRLAILDVSPVDPKRKLVLVRRDDTEHLLLIGGQNDLVVESGIQRVRTRRVDAPAAGRPEPEVSVDAVSPTPQPQVPHRRVPPPVPAPTPIPSPTVASREPTVAPSRVPVVSVQEEVPEPADLRAPPVAARSLPQDRAPERVGERPLPARAPSEERAITPTQPEQAPPALPAFLGVMTNRSQAAVRPQPPIAVTVPPAPTRPQIEPPQAEARPISEARAETAAVAPPAQPRSMATPTLPPQAVPVSAPRTEAAAMHAESEPSVSRTPPTPLVDEPLLETDTPIEERVRPPNRVPETREATDGNDANETAATPDRQPLSVRSFATTIQARRANPMPPVPPSPVAPPVVAPPRAPAVDVPPSKADPIVEAPRSSQPDERDVEAAAPRAERNPQPVAAQTPAPAPARTLTLEEEMERLLHDFTLDVTDRR